MMAAGSIPLAPFLQGLMSTDVDHCGVRSCVRPVDAVQMTAGLDVVRLTGSQSDYRAITP